jgi:hypothetical protein
MFKKVIVLTCPVKKRAAFWVPRDGIELEDIPVRFATKEEAMINGAKRLSHIRHTWPERLRVIVTGQPLSPRSRERTVHRV